MKDDANWHILTVTEGGTVSLLKNLTYEVAQKTMQRLPDPHGPGGDPWSEVRMKERVKRELARERVRPVSSGNVTFVTFVAGGGAFSSGDLKQVSCWGPEGEEMVVWPKPADYDEQYAVALEAARAALRETAQASAS